ncbi:MAG: hypothetical protein ACK5TM_08670 [Methylobacterium sp.]|jgi:hypothetical protein
MRVSAAFGLKKTQAELDFVDVDTDRDLKLFIDPYAIEIRDDALSTELQGHLVTYFHRLVETIRAGATNASDDLTRHLSEPRETFIGVSKGAPAGRGIGKRQAAAIIAALRRSRSFQTGDLSDLAETELFIEGISSDKLSDLATNVIRHPLERYTKEQCDLLGIPTTQVGMPPGWDPSAERWISRHADVPLVDGKPVLLIPKVLVRRKLSLDSQEFYNFHMLNYLQEEEKRQNGSLVRLLKNGKRVVHKIDLKARHPFEKPLLEEFARKHPDVLENYRKIKGATGPLTAKDFEEDFAETAFADALKNGLSRIPAGTKDAGRYHDFMIGALSFLLYPDLVTPIKEDPLHEGRKRIDIRYTNAGKDGFFHRIRTWPPASALYVPVECKNYTGEVANPELDQLSGRFGHQRGSLGFLVCRVLDDRTRFTERCRDTASDGRGFIVALDDEDVGTMLDLVAGLRRSQISNFLERKLREIVS